ncbi:putative metabolite transport protein NicT [Cupriavidus necator]|uniref:Putative metabolite transport protein NicT n=1 Tax=Cupriavidus necator TaxID=106590 RepID=A0A1K0ILK3_CUPNE|nr:putative metabolite transport protein NicT [Cupriavidus necator]
MINSDSTIRTSLPAEIGKEEEDKVFRRVTRGILPLLFICSMIALFDRFIVGFAKLQITEAFGLSAAAYGFGAGIFSLGYLLFEVPSNVILARVGAKKWIARIMVSWGIVTVGTILVRTPEQFYMARFLLGLMEAGFYPGIVYYLSGWFPRARFGRVMALLLLVFPISNLFIGPLSGWILESMSGSAGLAGWQWLFVVMGIPAILMGFVFFLLVADKPQDAKWLSAHEKRVVLDAIARDRASMHESGGWFLAFKDWRVWALGAIMAGGYLGLYGIVFWLPTMVQSAGVSGFRNIGLISSIPWIGTVLVTLVLGYSSDYFQERRGHFCFAVLLGALGFVISVQSSTNIYITIAGLSVACAFLFACFPPAWALASTLLVGQSAACGLALVNTVASFGSFIGPYLMGIGQERTGSLTVPLMVMAAICSVSALAIWLIPAHPPGQSGAGSRALKDPKTGGSVADSMAQ